MFENLTYDLPLFVFSNVFFFFITMQILMEIVKITVFSVLFFDLSGYNFLVQKFKTKKCEQLLFILLLQINIILNLNLSKYI